MYSRIISFSGPFSYPLVLLYCYIPLLLSGIGIPKPSRDRGWPTLVFWAAFVMFIVSILSPLGDASLVEFQYMFLPAAPSAALVHSLQLVAAPLSHLIMLATGSIIPRGPHFYFSPLLLAGAAVASSPLWAVPILKTSMYFWGAGAMELLIYPFFYAPFGIYMLVFGAARFWELGSLTCRKGR